jgi:D-alanyl-D-alanine carboxypeptidase
MQVMRSPRVGVGVAVVVLLAVLLGSSGVATAALDAAAARRRIVTALEADMAANPGIPGEVVAVRAPGLDVTVGAGLADVRAGTPLRGDTPFRIASVTKTFVAAAVLRLVERHRVRLDAPISKYLSRRSRAVLRADGYRPRRITVRQLLQHTAGLFDYASTDAYDDINVADPGHRWTRDEQLDFATAHGSPVGAPGKRYHYSDTGYILLGEIIERATGQSLPAAVRLLIGFRRLGLGHTYWEILEPTPPEAKPRAHQYYDDFDNITLDASHDLYGGGGLVSTVSDLTRFYRALFHGKVFHNRKTLRAMLQVSAPGRRAGAGMGIFRVDVDGERCFGHPGYWGTETIHCPRLNLTIARTTNQADDSDFDSGPLERVAADLARQAAPVSRSG